MPIASKSLVRFNELDVTTIDLETTDLRNPITWPVDRETERKLKTEVVGWLKAHPIRINDDPMVIVIREILSRMHAVLTHPSSGTAPEIEYGAVRRQIDADSRITGELPDACLAVFDITWCGVAIELECAFTKHAPDDDD